MKAIIQLIRVEQWTKNFLIFFPAFFAGYAFSKDKIASVIAAFIAFCFAASAIYIFNDYFDVEKDRNHPVKRFRPIASGKISKNIAILLMLFCLVIMALIPIFYIENTAILYWFLAYIFINFFYTILLKNIAIIDIACISSGFLIRIFIGGAAGQVHISKWLVLMTFLMAMSIALGKRRDDLIIDVENGKLRKSLDGYSLEFVNISLVMMFVISIVCYIMYCVSPEVETRLQSTFVYLTSIPLILGVLRYLQRVFVMNDSGSPTKILLKDHFIQTIIAVWILSFAYFLYF